MKQFNQIIGIILASSCMLFAGSAFAGAKNIISLVQDGRMNEFTANQSDAYKSKIGGLPLDTVLNNDGTLNLIRLKKIDILTANPVTQTGIGNIANITISNKNGAKGGVVYLSQKNNTMNISSKNRVTVLISGKKAFAAVAQIGSGNIADITVNGTLSGGSILQNGNGNEAKLIVQTLNSGKGSKGSIIINGNNNTNVKIVTDVDVTYILNGNNTQQTSPIIINSIVGGAAITITQTQF